MGSNDITATFVLVATGIVTFMLSRVLSRKWREKRRTKEEAERRAGETRQVRRARERRGK